MVGCACASGKTTIARWPAHRHDLGVYNADAHTWEHHDRSLAECDAGRDALGGIVARERRATRRAENESVVRQVQTYLEREPAAGSGG